MINLKPIQSASEALIVGAGSVGATEIINQLEIQDMGQNTELIKLGLQALIAVVTVIKALRVKKQKKSENE